MSKSLWVWTLPLVLVVVAGLGQVGCTACPVGTVRVKRGPPPFRRARLFNGAKNAAATVTVTGKVSDWLSVVEQATATPAKAGDSAYAEDANTTQSNQYKNVMITVTHDNKSATVPFDANDLSGNERYVEVIVTVRKVGALYKAHVVATTANQETHLAPQTIKKNVEVTLQ